MRYLTVLLRTAVLSGAALALWTASAQSRHERREARIAESAQPKNVKGGVTFQASLPYEKAYEAALNHLKRDGQTIEVAGKETGQIITAMDIQGKTSQTGTRIQVTVIKDSEQQTTIRVVVTEQKRKKILQADPWSEPKANEIESAKVAERIKAALAAAR